MYGEFKVNTKILFLVPSDNQNYACVWELYRTADYDDNAKTEIRMRTMHKMLYSK